MKIKLLLIALACFTFVANAQYQTGSFTNAYGWSVGDVSNGEFVFFGIIEASLEVKKSSIAGNNYYVVTFRNDSEEDVVFEVRVTDKVPERGHAVVRLRPVEEKTWNEHLPAELTKVNVLVTKPRAE